MLAQESKPVLLLEAGGENSSADNSGHPVNDAQGAEQLSAYGSAGNPVLSEEYSAGAVSKSIENDSIKSVDKGKGKTLLSSAEKLTGSKTEAVLVVPENPAGYEFVYSREVQIDPDLEGSFKEFAHKNGISMELAQKLVDFNCESLRIQNEKSGEQNKVWCEEVRELPGWQGRSFDEKITVAHRAVGRFVPVEVAELLDSTGYGNHPAVVKMFYEIGKSMSEDSFVDGSQSISKRDPASILYPNQGRY